MTTFINNNERFFPYSHSDLYFSHSINGSSPCNVNNGISNDFPWEESLFSLPDWNCNDLESCDQNFGICLDGILNNPHSPSFSSSDSESSSFSSIHSSPSSSPFQLCADFSEITDYANNSFIPIENNVSFSGKRDFSSFTESVPIISTKKVAKKAKRDGETKQVTRPKVKEGKGSHQCIGTNRKKGTQCRNAALMEYIGPRPLYCAEHIELDPKALYVKCKSDYQKDPGDNKGCKEIVLKEFGVCYKHFHDVANDMIRNRDHESADRINDRVNELHSELVKETANAKRTDADLFQRKNKLLPKFQEMKRMTNKTVETLSIIKAHEHAVLSSLPSSSFGAVLFD